MEDHLSQRRSFWRDGTSVHHFWKLRCYSRHYCVRGKSLIQFLHVNFVYKCEPVFFWLSISLATIIFSCVDILSSASCIKARPLFRSALCVAGSLIGRFYATKKCRRDPVESYSVSGPLEGSERPTTAKAAQCWGKEIRYRDTNSYSLSSEPWGR